MSTDHDVVEARFRASEDPWPSREADREAAAALVAQMTPEEKLGLLSAPMGYGPAAAEGAIGSAAHCAGVPRLGIPAWDESDASLGVTNPMTVREPAPTTAFPSSLALGATFDRELAEEQGRALGVEARTAGMTVQLAGGMNLIREPRGGRNFEYLSEDALLSGVLAGSSVRGIQEQGVISTVKHFALNAQETGRVMASSDLAEPELRASDLLAFEIALEHGAPRSVMTGYNQLNRVYASESPWLLSTVLKGDWGYPGFVMSDWGGTHSTDHAALAGLDRQSGYQLDRRHFFGEALARAVEEGRVPASRIDDMAERIVAALLSVGATGERRTGGEIPPETATRHGELAARIATESVVLLRHENDVLPLARDLPRLVVIGGRAETGVLSGGGSSAVTPPDAVQEEGFSIAQMSMPRVLHRPAPLEALRSALPEVEVVYLDGGAEEVASSLRAEDTAVVIVQHWATEGLDNPDLTLQDEQDALVSSVAAAAGRTVVVLETPGAVRMPWLTEVDAVLAAWYGGSGGAEAIAAVLSGAVSPAGRLPVTFPADEGQLPRKEMTDPASTTSNPGGPRQGGFPLLDYDIEGADVGYRWHGREGSEPLYWFGHGLSYTSFAYEEVRMTLDEAGAPLVSLTVRNTGERAGADVPQVYVAPPGGAFRLVGWARVRLEPGETREVRIVADDARCYAGFVVDDPRWVVEEGPHRVRLARSASPADVVEETELELKARTLAP